MNVTHIVVYLFEEDYCLFPCSSLENAYDRVDKSMQQEMFEQEFFQERPENVAEIKQALDEKRFGDAIKLYEESQYDEDGRFIEQFFIHSIESKNIDKTCNFASEF
jgi:hypothetical protein